MFASENIFDAQSGLPRSEKRYKRNFESYSSGQTIALPPVNPPQPDLEENPSVGNPPVTPQRRFVTSKVRSQCERKPSPSIPATGQSALVNPPHQRPVPLPTLPEPPWPT